MAERVATGKAARARSPRSEHGAFDPSSRTADPIELLERQAATRVPDLVPIRYGRMLASPFAFYRGAAIVMAADLVPTPRTGIEVQCCGDAHLSNFGVFGSPDRRLVFDINDFDETLPGPWEWDVKRLAASMVVASRENGHNVKDQRRIVLDTVAQYREAMREFAGSDNLAVWYARIDADELLQERAPEYRPKEVKPTERSLAKARTRDSMSAFSKLTQITDGQVRIVDQSPLIVPIDALAPDHERDEIFQWLQSLVEIYRDTLEPDRRWLVDQFELTDCARKVVGVGSVGTRCWITLLLGRDDRDPLFMQVKEAEASVLEEHLGESEFDNHGERVVIGQRRMQAASDIFLGWLRVTPEDSRVRMTGADGRSVDYYLRQLRDWKGSAEIDQLRPSPMADYGKLCGWTLARAHARSGDRVAIAAYLGSGNNFDRAILEFATAYADQNERDYQLLVDAARSGRITAQTGL